MYTYRQAFLHQRSVHPKSLKKCVPFTQALCLQRICSTNKEYHKVSIMRYQENEVGEKIEGIILSTFELLLFLHRRLSF